FQTKNEYIGSRIIGELYIRETSSLQDTVFLSEDKKNFKVKKKTIKELVKKNSLYNTGFPNGFPWEHVLKKDSVYQNIEVDKLSAVGDLGNSIPKSFELYQNYPNPFNPSTTIKYELPKESFVRINIYNLLGQKVKTLVNSNKKAGTHTTVWQGKDELRNNAASGIYIYRITAGKYVVSKKMALLR
ncbi:MAG TPA: T9SS type A sorting domain-containing protein, partial [Ignavibacteria bacterium]|nr:T9SS type A sorting domain-containing protein [Ignavibacteria bacterium]